MLLSVCYPFFRFYSGLLAAHVRTTALMLLTPIQARFTIASLIEQMSVSFIEPMKALPVEKLPESD